MRVAVVAAREKVELRSDWQKNIDEGEKLSVTLHEWLWSLEPDLYPHDETFTFDPEGEAKKRREGKKVGAKDYDPVFYFLLPLIDVSANYVEGEDDPLGELCDPSDTDSIVQALMVSYAFLPLQPAGETGEDHDTGEEKKVGFPKHMLLPGERGFDELQQKVEFLRTVKDETVKKFIISAYGDEDKNQLAYRDDPEFDLGVQQLLKQQEDHTKQGEKKRKKEKSGEEIVSAFFLTFKERIINTLLVRQRLDIIKRTS